MAKEGKGRGVSLDRLRERYRPMAGDPVVVGEAGGVVDLDSEADAHDAEVDDLGPDRPPLPGDGDVFVLPKWADLERGPDGTTIIRVDFGAIKDYEAADRLLDHLQRHLKARAKERNEARARLHSPLMVARAVPDDEVEGIGRLVDVEQQVEDDLDGGIVVTRRLKFVERFARRDLAASSAARGPDDIKAVIAKMRRIMEGFGVERSTTIVDDLVMKPAATAIVSTRRRADDLVERLSLEGAPVHGKARTWVPLPGVPVVEAPAGKGTLVDVLAADDTDADLVEALLAEDDDR